MAKPVDALPTWADDSNGGNYVGGPYAGQPRKVDIPGAIAAEGFRPGADDPSAAEHVNSWLNKLSKWITWVYEGTAAPATSATLVERTSLGWIQGESGVFAATQAGNLDSLSATGPTGEPTGQALRLYAEAPNTGTLISALHDNGGSCLIFEGGAGLDLTCHGNSNDGIVVVTDGDLARGLDITTSGDASDGVHVVTTGSAVNALYGQVDNALAYAVQGLALNNGTGGRFTGGVASGFGLQVEGKAAEGISCTGGTGPTVPAIKATGKLSAPGAIFTGGPSGADGVRGFATGAAGTNRAGVYGEGVDRGVVGRATSLLATKFGGFFSAGGAASGLGAANIDTGPAFEADTFLGSGTAGRFTSSTGRAVDASSTAGVAGNFNSTSGNAVAAQSSGGGHAGTFSAGGTRATVRLDPRSTNPATILEGGLWSRQDQGLLAHIAKNGGGAALRHLFDTAGGMCFAAAFELGPGTVDAQTTIVTATMTGSDAPVVTGRVLIVAVIEVGRKDGVLANPLLRIFNSTDGAEVLGLTETVMYQASGVDVFERHLVYIIPYDLPTAGNHTFFIELTSSNPGDEVNWRNAGLAIVGVF